MNTSIRSKLICFALSLPLLVGTRAEASTITFNGVITSGTLTHNVGSPGNFSGTVGGSGFNVGINTVYASTFPSFAAPGTYTLSDGAGEGIGGGYFYLNGTQYGCSATVPVEWSTCGVGFDIHTTFTLPDYGSSPPSQVTLTAPFTGSGGFFGEAGGQDYSSLNATGVGIATITLYKSGPSNYTVRSAVYQFAAVPEPATMTLAGLGCLAVILLRRRGSSAA